MNNQLLPWIVTGVVAVASLLLLAITLRRGSQRPAPPLPKEWALTARAVFSSDERRIYRLLREALPHHIILSKLALVRFCQPTDVTKVRYWYELLGNTHVTFAVCSANGRVLAAVDLAAERGHSSRVVKIKQSVLEACRVRYYVCPVDHLPTVAELQLLVPQRGAPSRAPLPAPTLNQARDTLANTVAHRRAERSARGGPDSVLFQDSFFALDSRLDSPNSEFGAFSERPGPSSGAQRSGGLEDERDSESPLQGARRR